MAGSRPAKAHRPRELRRRVVLPARLRTGGHWSDTCILNISSRGLLIHSAQTTEKGSIVEIRRGEHVIVGRVMWRDGARVGLQCEDRIPVEDIVTLGQSQAFQLTADNSRQVERRRRPRTEDDSRARGRAIEFIGVGLIAASVALSASAIVNQALAEPLSMVRVALGAPQS